MIKKGVSLFWSVLWIRQTDQH